MKQLKKWNRAVEPYVLEQVHGATWLSVEVDTSEKYREMMEKGVKKRR